MPGWDRGLRHVASHHWSRELKGLGLTCACAGLCEALRQAVEERPRILGCEYALRPNRISHLPRLSLMTASISYVRDKAETGFLSLGFITEALVGVSDDLP